MVFPSSPLRNFGGKVELDQMRSENADVPRIFGLSTIDHHQTSNLCVVGRSKQSNLLIRSSQLHTLHFREMGFHLTVANDLGFALETFMDDDRSPVMSAQLFKATITARYTYIPAHYYRGMFRLLRHSFTCGRELSTSISVTAQNGVSTATLTSKKTDRCKLPYISQRNPGGDPWANLYEFMRESEHLDGNLLFGDIHVPMCRPREPAIRFIIAPLF